MTTPSPRVLLISPQPFFEWRGSPIRVRADVQALVELGYEVDLLTTPVGMPCELPPQVHLHRVVNPFRIRRLAIGPSLPKLLCDILIFFHALGLLMRRRYAVLHGIEEAGFIAGLLGRLFGIPAVFEKHCDPASYRDGWVRNLVLRGYEFVERGSIHLCRAVITTGPGLAEQVRRVKPRGSAHHIFDVPSSRKEPDPREVAAIRASLRQGPADVLALYVGSFEVYQGIDLMFEALPKAARLCPDLRFVIIGGSDQEIARRKERLAGQGVADRVSFLGLIPPDRLPDFLAAADLLMSPRVAGLNTPLKLLDYLRAGRAVVSTDVPANRLILDETAALLVAPNSDAFADGIARLANTQDLRAKLAAEGLRLMERRYSFAEFAARLRACYDSLPRPRKHCATSSVWSCILFSRPAALLLEDIWLAIEDAFVPFLT